MKIAVVGAGKMGLPLACQFAKKGAEVLAVDINPKVVDAINEGKSPIDEPGVGDAVTELVAAGALKATADTKLAAAQSDAIVVIVPVLLTAERDADLSLITAAARQVGAGLKKGALVCFETTLPVGTTAKTLRPLLEVRLKAGKDFNLAFSPERVKSRKVFEHLEKNPKIVGGLTPACAKAAEEFYKRWLGAPVINLKTLEAAELAKLAGMVYRDVNIALANELSLYAEAVGVELAPVIAAANTDGESALLWPGIGVGGHCTPVYPYFLTKSAREFGEPATLAERSRRINDDQARRALDRLEREWSGLEGRTALVLGLGFRPQVKEHACSTAFLLREALARRGASVKLHDPLYSETEISGHGFVPGSLDDEPAPEVVVLNTAHEAYARLDFEALARRGVKAVVDGRNSWDPETVRAAGLHYVGIGRPAYSNGRKPAVRKLPLARPVLGAEEADAAGAALASGWVMQGPQVAAFEREFALAVGAKFACAVSSGTTALHLALLAAGVKPGDEVVTASHSFIATANAIRYCGAKPVFCDIEPGTFNLEPKRLKALLTDRTRAVLAVHQMGMPCDLKSILKITRPLGLPVVEDAACAIGSELNWEGRWERVGRPRGDISCFSFHPRKILTTGDGGMLTTANADFDAQFRLWRNHGSAGESYPALGYNYRLTDIQAAVGREQLKRLDGLVRRRRTLAARYRELLAPIKGLGLPVEPDWARSNWQSFCVRLPSRISREKAQDALKSKGADSKPGIMCAHLEPAYAKEPWSCGKDGLKESELAHERGLILPLFDGMTDADLQLVAKTLHETLDKA